MAEEERRRRRRRGRRRGRSDGHPSDKPPEEQREESQPEGAEESDKPEDAPSRFRFRFGRRRDREGEREETEEGAEHGRKDREERPAAGAPTGISPLSFWRRGRARTYREEPTPKQTVRRTLRRIGGLHFPPWLPVLFVMVLVSGILVVLFVARGAAGAPHIGTDHWHATYQTFICGQRQPNFPTWEASEGIHTHADGIIHMHPFIPAGVGAGARLVKWFGYGGGKLTQTELRMPGDRTEYKNGDTCPDGSEATVRVTVNGQELEDWSRYIPQDGDQVRIEFGTGEEAPVELDDRRVIDEEEASRTVELEITDTGGDESTTAFEPASIELQPGETVKLAVTNAGEISHSVRVAGPDDAYETGDDYVVSSASGSDIITPGEEGVLVVRFDEEGEFKFKDPTVIPEAGGTFVVSGEPVTEGADAELDGSEPVDVTFDLKMGDNFFEPKELEVAAGQSFRINLINEGELAHNLRITGPDGEYDTGDDLVSTPSLLPGGESGELVGQIDEPGEYAFRSDFQPTEMTGTITVK